MTPEAVNQSWDTHVHVFDHSIFPFKSDRNYTPRSVSLDSVIRESTCQNFVLVQASFEDGIAGIIHHLEKAHQEFHGHKFRAEVLCDATETYDLDKLHELGVRCLRLHGEYGNGSTSYDWVLNSLRKLCEMARVHGWAVAAQLPLATWIDIIPRLGLDDGQDAGSESDPLRDPRVPIIAEHFGSPPLLPLSQIQQGQFEEFVGQLSRSKRFFVKLSGLHRRVSPSASIEDLIPLVAALAERAPHALLYGSDFPHVDVVIKSLELTNHLNVDHRREAQLLQKAMPDEVWKMVLVDNPLRIFQ